jgi:hypothetical protein
MQKIPESLVSLLITGQTAYSVRVHEKREGSKYEIMATSPSELFR